MEANKKIVVYLDMDGPLCDFMREIEGCEWVESTDDHYLKDPLPMLEPDFFERLTPTESALESVRKILASDVFDVYINTKITSKNLDCASGKVKWIKKYLPELIDKMFLVCDKGKLIGDYLIDDSPALWAHRFGGTFIPFDDEQPINSWKYALTVLSKHDPSLLEE